MKKLTLCAIFLFGMSSLLFADSKAPATKPSFPESSSVAKTDADPEDLIRRIKKMVEKTLRQARPYLRQLERDLGYNLRRLEREMGYALRDIRRELRQLERQLGRELNRLFQKRAPKLKKPKKLRAKIFKSRSKKKTIKKSQPKSNSKKKVTISEPSEAEKKKLVEKTLTDFHQAVQKKDFTDFHKTLSSRFQKLYTPEKLKNIFQIFIDQKKDLSKIKGKSPLLSQASTFKAQREMMVLVGHYSTSPEKIYFRLTYKYEDGQWKLLGIFVNMR